MQYHQLGRTNLQVSQICLGTMTWAEQNTQEEAFEQMDAALDYGVNFFDTAELYPVPPRLDEKPFFTAKEAASMGISNRMLSYYAKIGRIRRIC